MILRGFDTETTGLEQADGHRIIEVAILSYDSDTRQLVDKYVQRIDPERPIDPKAQAVHGIDYSQLIGCPKWEQVAPTVHHLLSTADVVIAHNIDFDMPFTQAELRRVGSLLPPVRQFCTMENGRWATFDGKSPKLGELCFALNIDYDPNAAHAADYDVDVMMQCFFAGLDRGFYKIV
ncbi:exonuclease domain-containing protein [Acinetobacter baumannii]|uniref:3'-5' exonuclease n=1 Tax=Acinetobacter baumannii TaxID=470 RepID=UPI002999E0B7|nr:3'-5' exonuclease [Acinetobacter baumannii]